MSSKLPITPRTLQWLLIPVLLFGFYHLYSRHSEDQKKSNDRDVAATDYSQTYGGQIGRVPPQPVATADDYNRLLPHDRHAVLQNYEKYDINYGKHCTERDLGGRLDDTCGVINGVQNGDHNFHPHGLPPDEPTFQYSKIPKSSKIKVRTACDQRAGVYYSDITYTTPDGRTHNFVNPYDGSQRCLTSPGREEDAPTNIARITKPRSYITAWHEVSARYSYAEAIMPWVTWIKYDEVNEDGSIDYKSFAYHAETKATPVDGWPASAGCFRMTTNCAKGLFNLVRRVGSNNIEIEWDGYKTACKRPAHAKKPVTITHTESLRVRRGIERRNRQWFLRRFLGTGVPDPNHSTEEDHDPRGDVDYSTTY